MATITEATMLVLRQTLESMLVVNKIRAIIMDKQR